MQYFVTLVNTLSHFAILVQYFVTQPTLRVIENKELVRIAGSQVCELWEPCDLQEVCGLHLERKGKVSGWLCRNAFAILVQYFCNPSLHTKKKVRSLWVRMQTVVCSSLTGSCLRLVSSANMSTHNLRWQSGT